MEGGEGGEGEGWRGERERGGGGRGGRGREVEGGEGRGVEQGNDMVLYTKDQTKASSAWKRKHHLSCPLQQHNDSLQ